MNEVAKRSHEALRYHVTSCGARYTLTAQEETEKNEALGEATAGRKCDAYQCF